MNAHGLKSIEKPNVLLKLRDVITTKKGVNSSLGSLTCKMCFNMKDISLTFMKTIVNMNIFNLKRKNKIIILFLLDSLLAYLSYLVSIFFRDGSIQPIYLSEFALIVIAYQLFAIYFKNYKIINSYFNNEDIERYICIAFFFSLALTIMLFAGMLRAPKSTGAFSFLIVLFLLIVSRKVYVVILNYKNKIFSNEKKIKIIIFGADRVGINIINKIDKSKHHIYAFVDEDLDKQNLFVSNIKIYSKKGILLFLDKIENKIDYFLVNQTNLNNVNNKQFFELISNRMIPIKLINESIYKNLESNIDLLSLIINRDFAEPEPSLMSLSLNNKTLLITGAGGSIGSEIIRQSVVYNPKKIILLDNSEFALFKIYREILDISNDIELVPVLESITSNRLEQLFRNNTIDVIYHAAAYKHVGLVELNPLVSIYNNIIGLDNILNISLKYGIKNFVLISTDKAVRPSNIMGLTKRVSELIVYNKAINFINTKFDIVRFGNVAGSSGSVIEVFKKQISLGKPLTITHENATRFFMSIPEAAQLVIQSTSLSNSNGIFILDMGKPVKIIDLAKTMLNNYSDNNSGIIITGLGKGEKIEEELTVNNAIQNTLHPKIKIALNELYKVKNIDLIINFIRINITENNTSFNLIINELKKIIPEYDFK